MDLSEVDEIVIVDENPIKVQIVQGSPTFEVEAQMQQRLLANAGLPRDAAVDLAAPPSRSAFHVATLMDGSAVGAIHTVIGLFDELPIRRHTDPAIELPGPVCECSAMAVSTAIAGLGAPELLYRSVFRFAREQGAVSIAASVSPLDADFLRQSYGLPFEVLGGTYDHFGVEMMPIGGVLDVIEAGVRTNHPDFFNFLT